MVRRIEKILERWFLLEPPLFQVLCLHELIAEDSITCPIRSGEKRVEYNPDMLGKMTDEALEEVLKIGLKTCREHHSRIYPMVGSSSASRTDGYTDICTHDGARYASRTFGTSRKTAMTAIQSVRKFMSTN